MFGELRFWLPHGDVSQDTDWCHTPVCRDRAQCSWSVLSFSQVPSFEMSCDTRGLLLNLHFNTKGRSGFVATFDFGHGIQNAFAFQEDEDLQCMLVCHCCGSHKLFQSA